MIEIVSWVFEILAMVACLHKFHRKKLRVEWALVLLIMYDIVLLYGVNYLDFSRGLTISIYIAFFTYSLYIFKSKRLLLSIECVLAIVIPAVMQLVFYVPVSMIIGNIYLDIEIGCVVNGLCLGTIVLLGNRFSRYGLVEYVRQKDYLTYLCMASVLMYLFFNIYSLRTTDYLRGTRIWEILIWIILIVVMWLQVQKNRNEKEKKDVQLQEQEEYVQIFEKQLYAVRIKQHDIKNHLYAFCGMTEELKGQKELICKQKAYRTFLLEDDDYESIVKGGNPIFTGFLNKKIAEMKKGQIDFQYELSYVKLNADFSIYEWIELAGILLDNAIEAVEKQLPKCKRIKMELFQDSLKTCLKVANISSYISSDERNKFFEVGYSTKGEMRGIGLAKVKQLVAEKKGEIVVRNIQIEEYNWIEFSFVIYH